jgi:hypothetical protein
LLDEQHILTLGNAAAERESARLEASQLMLCELSNVYALIHGVLNTKTFEEHRNAGNSVEFDLSDAVGSFQDEINNDRTCFVRYWCFENDRVPGQVVKTTETYAKTITPMYASRVPESEAAAYARVVSARKGRWMDETSWRRFTGNYARVRNATAIKRRAA